MRAIVFCLLALVAGASARDLQQLVATSCVAASTASLNLDGSGSGMATGMSFCEAEAEAKSAIEKIISDYIIAVKEDAASQCTEVKASESVTGIAKAIASAYASASAEVVLEGTGEACATAFAAADALAIAFVDVILEVSVRLIEEQYPDDPYGQDVGKAVKGKQNEATGAISGRAVAVVISTAWAQASAAACTDGGLADDFETSFVQSITTAVAELWGTVIVELCSKFDDAKNDELKDWEERTSSSFSDIAGEIDVDDLTTIDGTGSGISAEVLPCTDPKDECCDITATKCDCGPGCDLTVFSFIGLIGQTIWADSTDMTDLCRC